MQGCVQASTAAAIGRPDWYSVYQVRSRVISAARAEHGEAGMLPGGNCGRACGPCCAYVSGVFGGVYRRLLQAGVQATYADASGRPSWSSAYQVCCQVISVAASGQPVLCACYRCQPRLQPDGPSGAYVTGVDRGCNRVARAVRMFQVSTAAARGRPERCWRGRRAVKYFCGCSMQPVRCVYVASAFTGVQVAPCGRMVRQQRVLAL